MFNMSNKTISAWGLYQVSLLALFIIINIFSCNNPTTQTPPYFGATLQSTAKPTRDTVKGVVLDHYQRSVTTTWDSIVVVGIAATTPPPVDTVVVPPPVSGYALTYENTFSKPTDIDPQDHGQKGNGYIDNGWFRSRPADVSAGVRSEVQLDNNMLPLEGATEYDVEYIYIVQNQCHSFQVHGSTDGSSAILAMWHMNGNFVVRTNSGGSNISQVQAQMKISTGHIYHMRCEYKIGSSGYYRWYIDGKLYASFIGKIQNGSSQWVKLGFNGGFDNNKTEAMRSDIKYDNWRIYKKISSVVKVVGINDRSQYRAA